MTGTHRSSRFFTTRYNSVYATHVLEAHGYLRRLPKTKIGKKVFYEILKDLPSQDTVTRFEKDFFKVDGITLLWNVQQDLLTVARRSLRHGARLLAVKAGDGSVERVETEMMFFKNCAREIEEIIERQPELGQIIVEYRPDPLLLYPTRGWPLRRVILDSCLIRLRILNSHLTFNSHLEQSDLLFVIESLEGENL